MRQLYYFAVADYFATGEGRSIWLLVTRAYPKQDDYAVEPSFDENEKGEWVYNEGELKYTLEDIALRNLKQRLDPYFAVCAEVVSEDKFFNRYGHFVPEVVESIIKGTDPRGHPGGFEWFQDFHFNFS